MSVRGLHGRYFGGLYMMAALAPDGGGGGGGLDLKTLESQVKDLGISVKQASDTVKQAADAYKAELKNLGEVTSETKQKVDQALTEASAQKGRLDSVEQAIARLQARKDGGEKPASVGQQFVESDMFKALQEQFAKGGSMAGKVFSQAIVSSLTTDAAGSAGAAVEVDRQAGILTPALRRMTVRDLLMPGQTTSNLIEYVKEKGFTNNAAPQVETEAKGQSDIQLELKQSPVRTIAHFMIASKQILDDAPAVRSLIDTRLRYGLRLEEEDQLLNGDGTGVNLDGLINNSTAYSSPMAGSVTDEQYIDVLRQAMLQAFMAEWPATGHILHPADWARIELTKDADGRYIFANPLSLAGPVMWGIPVVQTQSMRETKFLTGAFVPAAQIFDRQGVTVEISTEDSDNFRKNLITIRAEQRLTVVVYRDEALIYGDFGENS